MGIMGTQYLIRRIWQSKRIKYCVPIILIFCFTVTAGCSRQGKEKFLRTFFDGVPSIEEEQEKALGNKEKEILLAQSKESKAQSKETKKPIEKEQVVFYHPPFAQNQCDSCHDKKFSQKLVEKGSKLCFSCHDDFTKDKKIVHFPVSEGNCVDCHDPHQSENKFLLNMPVPQVCFPCHEQKDLLVNPAHEGVNNCMECHSPHALNQEKLLK